MKIRIKIKDAILITISLILLWVSYFFIKDYEFHIENIGGHLSVTKTNLMTKKYEDIAVEALYAKQYEKALEYFNKELKTDPPHLEDVYHNIGMTYYYLHKYDNAIEYLNKSLELDDKLISTYFYLGLSYDGIGRMSRAKENYEKTITMEGRNKDPGMVKIAYEKLGWIEELFGNHQKAQEYWEKAR